MPPFIRAAFAAALLGAASLVSSVPAADAPPLARTIDRIPHTPREVAEAHDKSDLLCVQLPEDSPLAERDFSRQVRYEVRRPASAGGGLERVPYDYGRWPAVAYGTRMTAADKKTLPFFTSGTILKVIEKTYTSLQVRVHRAAPDGAPYLYYVPFSCIGEYGKAERSVEFADLQKEAVKDVRGLGLFLPAGQPHEPAALRTFVVSIRSTLIEQNADPEVIKIKPLLELLFVRMRVREHKGPEAAAAAVELHVFVTSEDLQKLVYFKPYATPANVDACDLVSTIRITEYSVAGQVPSARAAREVHPADAREFTMASLNAYAAQAGLGDSAFDRMTEVLDAIIDGAVK